MTIDIECPRCKAKLTWPVTAVVPGRVLECPHCGYETVFTERDIAVLRESRSRIDEDGI